MMRIQTVVVVLVVLAVVSLGLLIFNTPASSPGDPVRFVDSYRQMEWSDIVRAARGQTVYFHAWGGSESINSYLNEYVAEHLRAEWEITLEVVPLADTADAVHKILADKEINNRRGAIDLIWINGENFRTLREAKSLFGPFADLLPNRRYIDPNSPALQADFGYPVEDYESPWGAARFVFVYNSSEVATPPPTMEALVQWIKEHPNRFTYPRPPNFVGSAFVRQVLYLVSGHTDLGGPLEEGLYRDYSETTWQLLNDIEPLLWRSGRSYPESPAHMQQLFANGEIWFDMDYNPARAANLVEQGIYPESARTYVLDSGTLGNTHFVAIPYNAPSKAGAMVVANFLLSPPAQYQKNLPAVWGDPTALTLELLPDTWQTAFRELTTHPSAASPLELNKRVLPELGAMWLSMIERDWEQEVLLR